jgi:putative ABC transport system permease protein
METLMQDVRYALRQLRRTPGFAFAAIFALALGIGANVAIFSTVNAVLLNSLPFRFIRQPERLVSLYETNPALLPFLNGRLGVTHHNLLAWRAQARSFAGIEGYEDASLNMTSADGHEPERVDAVSATPGFLPMLGVAPRLGRNFDSAHANVVLISDDLWRSRFSADPNIIGRMMRASDTDYQIIGVLPERFELPATQQGFDQSKPKVWMPLILHAEAKDQAGPALNVVARLKPGITLEQARAEMRLIANRLAKQFPDTNRGWGVNVFPTISEDIDPNDRRSLYVLQLAVGFVLLIACANVANLLLTKAVAREREMAVRLAVGATRWRILRQNLTESLVLSAMAGTIGFLLSLVLMRLVTYLAPKDSHGLHELTVNPLVLAFALGVTLLSGLLFGLAPGIHSARQVVAEALNRGSRSVAGSARRFRGALVVVEIALSLILLIGAGLTIRSVVALMTVNQGFRMDHLLTMGITLPSEHYKNPEQMAAFNDQLLERVQRLPGVRAASLSTALPMRSISEESYGLPGVPSDPDKMKVVDWSNVTEQHVEALGLHLLRGRNLTRADVTAATPEVALVNEAFAKANWPNQDAIGKVFLFHSGKLRVVGVVGDIHQIGPDQAPHTEVYIPGHRMQSMQLVVRTIGDPLAMGRPVEQQVWALDKDQPVNGVTSMESVLSEWVAPKRFTMTVMIAFGVIALISAAVGLYSVLAYAVSLRTREIGVRVALGAGPNQVAGMILREGLVLAMGGLAAGLAGAYFLTRFMQSLIFGIQAFDLATFAAVSLLLMGIALFACYVPARRAARVNPSEALRAE